MLPQDIFLTKFMHKPNPEKITSKMEAISVILKITVLSKQAPIGRKFAQSGHPVNRP
jgi:hypothetical protein